MKDKNGFNFRQIRSFVCRRRRLTKRQQHAISNYLPIMGIEFKDHFVNFIKIFGRDAPIVLEIGFGMGLSLVKMAKKNPEYNFLGIEVYLPGIGACLASAFEEGVKNLRIIGYDAVEVLNKMIPNNSLNITQLFFPDPWYKARHSKRRIIQVPFAEMVRIKLKIGGIFHIITDWKPYADHIIKVISSIKGYKNYSLNKEYIASNIMSKPITKFEKRSHLLGYNKWDMIFERIK